MKRGSRTPSGANRWRRISPGTPATIVNQKKERQPAASTISPVIGPPRMRGRPKSDEKSAYWVAENLFSVMRRRRTPNAPMPRPLVIISNAIAPYMTGRPPGQ